MFYERQSCFLIKFNIKVRYFSKKSIQVLNVEIKTHLKTSKQ